MVVAAAVAGTPVVVVLEDSVVDTVAGGAQAAKTSNRAMPAVLSDVASAHYKAKKESSDGSPDEGEVVTS